MGKIEQKARRVRHLGQVQKAVLGTVATVGILSVMLVAPNALQLLRGINKTRWNDRVSSANKSLIRRGYLKEVKKNNQTFLEITQKGEGALEEISIETVVQSRLVKKHRWDKRWRLVIYDLPQSKKKLRDQLRLLLVRTGFTKIQGSVWVFPYDCEELIVLIKTELHVGREVLYAVVEKIENDSWLRKHFKLPLDD